MSNSPSLLQQYDPEEPSFPFLDSTDTSRFSSPLRSLAQSTAPSPFPTFEYPVNDVNDPFANLTTPIWSPVGQLDTIPLTPWESHTFYPSLLGQTATIPPPTESVSLHLNIDSHVQNGSLLFAPPNTASLPQSALGNHYTGLTPLLANFATDSPTSATSPHSGPVRGWSNMTPAARRRSSTLLNTSALSSSTSVASPATPQSSYSAYPGYFPYPSPRSSASSASGYSHAQAMSLRRRATTGPANALQMTPGLPGPKRIHPSPMSASPLYSLGTAYDLHDLPEDECGPGGLGLTMGLGMGYRGRSVGLPPLADVKPARFKPTKEQLAILIGAYNKNKSAAQVVRWFTADCRNPDAQTREQLAKQIGGGVKPKTLQIWFQNRSAIIVRTGLKLTPRRSKARAKEREANLPRLQMFKSEGTPFGSAAELQKKSAVLDALRRLTHEDDLLSVSPWTRFVTPGSESTSPDLGASLSFSPEPRINLYVVHESETYRISFAISSAAMSALQLVNGTKGLTDHAMITFELVAGAADFWTWSDEEETAGVGAWTPIVDFTGGVVSQGGRCDMTGSKEIITPAYNQIQALLASQQPPASAAAVEHSTWRFPMASTPPPTRATHSAHSTSTTLSHSIPESFNLHSSASSPSPVQEPSTMQYLAFDPSSSPFHTPMKPARPHMRQRSLSAPDLQTSSEQHLAQDVFGLMSPLASRSNTLDGSWSLGALGALGSPAPIQPNWTSPGYGADLAWSTEARADMAGIGSVMSPSSFQLDHSAHACHAFGHFDTGSRREAASTGETDVGAYGHEYIGLEAPFELESDLARAV